MIQRAVCTLLASLLTCSAHANINAWSQKTSGGVISVGGQILSGRALLAPDIPSSAKVSSISWRIVLLTPPPPELKIKLCNATKCLNIPTLSGQMNVKIPFSAADHFRFIYVVNHPGQLSPTLNVISNELTVNYRR
ncbi:MAG: flagellar protein FlhE [Kluyvera sp.]